MGIGTNKETRDTLICILFELNSCNYLNIYLCIFIIGQANQLLELFNGILSWIP